MEFTNLDSKRIMLRRFTDVDLNLFLAYRNDPLVAKYQGWESFSHQETKAFIEEQKTLEPGTTGKWFQFAIELKESNQLIGDCGLKINSEDGQQGEIGFTISREYQGKGYGGEAVCCVLDFAFSNLTLHRIVAITDCRNLSSVALLERLGFRREGHFIQNVWFKGEWGDEYLYAMLNFEWEQRKEKLNHA
ncbi:MAG: GNAT family protein [Acidobacteriota bacterium]